MQSVGRVVALARFPVKSTAGELLTSAVLDARGFAHDRQWAMYLSDGGIVSGKTTRRFRKIDGAMLWRSTMPAADRSNTPHLQAPDGTTYSVDDPGAAAALTAAFGQPVTLQAETTTCHHDESGVSLVTTSAIRQIEQHLGAHIDPARLRANIVLDTEGTGFLEDDWIGCTLAIGDEVALTLGPGMPRCVMLDQPQSAVSVEVPMLTTVGAVHNVLLGLQASVHQTGELSLGDEATLYR